jgi:hypothetical protein
VLLLAGVHSIRWVFTVERSLTIQGLCEEEECGEDGVFNSLAGEESTDALMERGTEL